jgi:hypothetical protein
MTVRPAHFHQIDGSFLPNRYAHSHWGDDHLNGPAIVGLAARTLENQYGSGEFQPARLTVDLLRAARSLPTRVTTRLVRDGRRIRSAEADVVQGEVTVARATLVFYRRSAPPPGELWQNPVTFTPPVDFNAVDESPKPYTGSDEVGWTRRVGDHQNGSRTRFFDRGIDVVEGEENSPFVRAAIIAEQTSLTVHLGSEGIGYINGDVTVALARLPRDGWIGVQADSEWAADGISVGSSTLFDSAGAFGTGLVTAIANPASQIDFAASTFQGHRI